MHSLKGVYAIICDNGKAYIGSTLRNIPKRLKEHFCLLRRGKHHCIALQRAFAKYGADAFAVAVLEQVSIDTTSAIVIEAENRFIALFKGDGGIYNVAPVAGSPLGVKHSAEARARMSAAQRRRAPATAETCAKISAAVKSRPPQSAETCAKIAAAHRGRKRDKWMRDRMSEAAKRKPPKSPEAIEKWRASNIGKKRSPETIDRMKIARRNRQAEPPVSEETRRKMSEAHKRRYAALATQSF